MSETIGNDTSSTEAFVPDNTFQPGRNYTRKEINGHWVEYTYRDSEGTPTRRVSFPRLEIIPDSVIEELDRMDAEQSL